LLGAVQVTWVAANRLVAREIMPVLEATGMNFIPGGVGEKNGCGRHHVGLAPDGFRGRPQDPR